MKEQIEEVKHCGCEFGLFIMPFAYDTSFLNRVKISTTILCTCCGKKVTRITKKGAVKAWNRKTLDKARPFLQLRRKEGMRCKDT